MFKLWEVDDGENHYYSATSKEQALELHLEPLRDVNGEVEDYMIGCKIDEIKITEISDDIEIPIWNEDDNQTTKKTAAEWAVEGPGFVASTVW